MTFNHLYLLDYSGTLRRYRRQDQRQLNIQEGKGSVREYDGRSFEDRVLQSLFRVVGILKLRGVVLLRGGTGWAEGEGGQPQEKEEGEEAESKDWGGVDLRVYNAEGRGTVIHRGKVRVQGGGKLGGTHASQTEGILPPHQGKMIHSS